MLGLIDRHPFSSICIKLIFCWPSASMVSSQSKGIVYVKDISPENNAVYIILKVHAGHSQLPVQLKALTR